MMVLTHHDGVNAPSSPFVEFCFMQETQVWNKNDYLLRILKINHECEFGNPSIIIDRILCEWKGTGRKMDSHY
jgi:hypothetical protein